MIEEQDNREPFMVCVSFGEADEVTLDMIVIQEEFDVADDHLTRWSEITHKDEETAYEDFQNYLHKNKII